MPQDDDISRLLPRPPLPAPARRDAAISEALRRFDGGAPAAQPQPAREPKTPARWPRINRPMASALAAAGVAVLIALPLALSTMPPPQETPATNAPPPAAMADAASSSVLQGPPPSLRAVPAAEQPQPPPSSGVTGAPHAAAPARPPAAAREPAPALTRQLELPAQPQPQRMALAEAADTDDDLGVESIVVSGSRIARPSLSSTSPLTVVGNEDALARRAPAAAAAAGRGDWNACTVQDPARNLAACRRLVDPAASGPRGRAAAHLADGLTQAWQGDQTQAIASFDRAIAADPRSALAHLNRALAWQRSGNPARALADLDRAVRLDPRSARLYYHRALLLRQRGDTARARADESRAIQLDPAYAPLLRPPG